MGTHKLPGHCRACPAGGATQQRATALLRYRVGPAAIQRRCSIQHDYTISCSGYLTLGKHNGRIGFTRGFRRGTRWYLSSPLRGTCTHLWPPCHDPLLPPLSSLSSHWVTRFLLSSSLTSRSCSIWPCADHGHASAFCILQLRAVRVAHSALPLVVLPSRTTRT